VSLLDQERDEQRFGRKRALLDSRFIILLSVSLAFAVVALFQLKGSESSPPISQVLVPERFVDLSKPSGGSRDPRSDDDSEKPALRVAVAPVLSPEESIQMYEGLVEYLAGALGRRPVFLQRKSYAETNDLVRYGLCDLALVCTYSLVRGEQEFGMEVLAVPVVDGVTEYHSLIVVSEANPADSLTELRGQRFASADIISTSGWLYPAMWLKERGINADEFFSEHLIVGSHDRSIRAVASGYADAAAVHSLVYEQVVNGSPEISGKTRIIQKSPPYGMPPVVVSPDIDPALRDESSSTLLSMHQNSTGKGVLKEIGIDRFVAPEAAIYDDIRKAVKAWESR